MAMRPLFIPLARRYFEQFWAGQKNCELRPYGPRWNESTCTVGRAALLSCGYGKGRRLRGQIAFFRRVQAADLESAARQAVLDCYGTLEMDVAVIGLSRLEPVSHD